MTITPRTITELYRKCQCKNPKEVKRGKVIEVHPLKTLGCAHFFTDHLLEQHRSEIIAVLRKMPQKMRGSVNREGVCWVSICQSSGFGKCDMDVAERIYALGVAIGYIRTVESSLPVDVAFLVLDDVRMEREQLMRASEVAREKRNLKKNNK